MRKLPITAKGEVTLGKDLMNHLGVSPGGKLVVSKLSDGRIELKTVPPAGDISDVFGCLKRKGARSLSLEDINEFAARGWAGKQ